MHATVQSENQMTTYSIRKLMNVQKMPTFIFSEIDLYASYCIKRTSDNKFHNNGHLRAEIK